MVVCPRCGTEAKAAELLLLATPEPVSSPRSRDPEFVNAATILAMRSPSGEVSNAKPESPWHRGAVFLATLDRANRFVGGRRCRLFAIFVASLGIAFPLLDHYSWMGQANFTIVFGDLLLLWLWLLLFSWTTSLHDESGKWRSSRLGSGLGVLFNSMREAVAEWRHATTISRLRACGIVLLWVGVALLALHGILTLVAAVFTTSTARTNALPIVPWWLGVAGVGSGLCALLWAALIARRATLPVASNRQLAPSIDDLPTIIDLKETRPHEFGSSDTCHVVLNALAKWNERTRKRYGSRDAYVAALARHLRRVDPSLSVRREVWLGRTREMGVADLVAGDQLLIHVQKGFDREAADWSLSQLRACQLTRPKSPKLLVVFDAERNQLLNSTTQKALGQMRQHARAVAARV